MTARDPRAVLVERVARAVLADLGVTRDEEQAAADRSFERDLAIIRLEQEIAEADRAEDLATVVRLTGRLARLRGYFADPDEKLRRAAPKEGSR